MRLKKRYFAVECLKTKPERRLREMKTNKMVQKMLGNRKMDEILGKNCSNSNKNKARKCGKSHDGHRNTLECLPE